MCYNNLILINQGNTMSISSYSVSSVKTFKGHDGFGYSCFLLRGKKKVAEVVDDGWGGGLQFRWLDNTSAVVHTRTYDDKPHSFNGTVEESMFYAEVMKLPKIPAENGLPEMFTDPDIVVGDMVNEILLEKDIAKELKKNFNIKTQAGEILTWKISTKFPFDVLKAHVTSKYPQCLVINELSVSEVIKIYKEHHLI